MWKRYLLHNANSEGSDDPVHPHSLIRAFAVSSLNIGTWRQLHIILYGPVERLRMVIEKRKPHDAKVKFIMGRLNLCMFSVNACNLLVYSHRLITWSLKIYRKCMAVEG